MNSTFAKELTSNVKLKDNSGEHLLVIKKVINQNNTGEHLSVKKVAKGKDDWALNDYVNNCEVDINLSVIKESIEVNNSFIDGEGIVSFAYKIGCIGGLDPVTVKYFAFKKWNEACFERGGAYHCWRRELWRRNHASSQSKKRYNSVKLYVEKMEGYFKNKNKLTL